MPYHYVISEMTQEITGPIEFPVIPGLGVSIPSNAIELPERLPLAEQGYVWAWRNGSAVQLLDVRNHQAYRKDNGILHYWTELGPVPDYLTFKPRPNAYHSWKDDDWALDCEAQRAGEILQASTDRDRRLHEVVIRVAPLQFAYELGEATSEQLLSLQAWKRYAVNLVQIEQQPEYPMNITWPTAPVSFSVSPVV